MRDKEILKQTDIKIENILHKLERIEQTFTNDNCMQSLQEYDYLLSVLHNLLNVKRYEFGELIDIAATAHFEELKAKAKKEN